MKLILASASQRRQELLKRIIDEFDVVVSDFKEDDIKFEGSYSEYVMSLAKGKAINVAEKVGEVGIIIGCDTIVAFDNQVLEKPKNRSNAFDMLKALSGNTHEVYSGIAIVDTINKKTIMNYVSTSVKFSSLTNEEIEKYISTEEPMDKAGAYGIQGFGGVFVEEIHGDYYNVVGLPLNKLNKMLKGMGVNL